MMAAVATNDMVTIEDLAYLPGAPFEADEVDGAVETLRKALRWRIAPEETETITFDVMHWETKLRLPTAYLVSIDEVRANGVIVPSTSYQASKNLSILARVDGSYWPEGYGTVEVDMTHGYEEVPKDLLNILAAIAATSRRDQAVREAVAGTYVLPLVGIDNVVYRYVPWHSRFGWA
jgi:hypothetical protein